MHFGLYFTSFRQLLASSFRQLKMLILIYFNMPVTNIFVGDCSVLEIKCFDRVDHELIDYERKSLQISVT